MVSEGECGAYGGVEKEAKRKRHKTDAARSGTGVKGLVSSKVFEGVEFLVYISFGVR
jgi:hypothetical protein